MTFGDENGKLLKVRGLISGDGYGEKNLEILQKALTECLSGRFSGLALPNGIYQIYNKKAIYLFECLLNGTINTLDNERWKSEKNIVLDIKGVKNFTIRGDSTKLEFKGMIQPFNFTDCEGITVENISIDWIDTFYFSADVVAKKANTTFIVPHENYAISGGEPVVSINSIDPKTGRQGGMALFENITNIKKEADNLFSFNCAEPEYTFVGQSLVLRYLYSYAPVFLYYKCSNVKLENVNVSAGPGMAVVAQKCKDISFVRLTVTNSKGRLMSVNCDATHLINCYGTIKYDNCFFEGMGDDAANIHGFYLKILKIEDDKIYIKHDSSSQNIYPYVPEKGNDIEFVNEKNLLKIQENTITELVYDNTEHMYYIKVKNDIGKEIHTGTLIACVSEMPQLIFNNCAVRNIRGRGLLIQTRNVTIKNCLFDGCTGQALHVDTAYDWGESIGARNVNIRNNKFIDCGFGSTKYCDAVAVVVETEADEEAAGVHRDIVIRDNIIMGKENAFKLSCCKDVLIENNMLIKCNKDILQSFVENIKISSNSYF